MKKKIILIALIVLSFNFLVINETFSASKTPTVNCIWLPGCEIKDINNLDKESVENNIALVFLGNVIWEFIKYVSVIAVISLMISGIMYMISQWEEEKEKKARSRIIWSLVWVVISISAWWIINMLNTFSIL